MTHVPFALTALPLCGKMFLSRINCTKLNLIIKCKDKPSMFSKQYSHRKGANGCCAWCGVVVKSTQMVYIFVGIRR